MVPTITKDFKFDITNNEINKNNISLMWMFADFIEASIVGEFLLPILRMIPIDLSSSSGASEHTIFAHQHYVPVKRCKMQDFGITLRERLDGEPINFIRPVIVTLHFQRINVEDTNDALYL